VDQRDPKGLAVTGGPQGVRQDVSEDMMRWKLSEKQGREKNW